MAPSSRPSTGAASLAQSAYVAAYQAQKLGRTGVQPGEGAIERFIQFCPAPEVADLEKVVDRLDQDFVTRVAGVRVCLDCTGQKPVGSVDIAYSVEQVIRGCHRASQRTRMLRIALTHHVEQLRGVAKITQKVGAEIGGLPPSDGPGRRQQD
jgi:hypothetical protein